MAYQYTYYTRWEKNVVVILRIYGARAISLLFCNHQDTEPESQEMEIGAAGSISIHKISKPLWDNGIHTPQYGR